MRRVLPLFAVGLLLVGLVGVFSVTQAVSSKLSTKYDTPTVGEFVVRYAQTVGLAGDHSTAEEALGTLRASGLIGTTPVTLDSRLTEGDVVRLTQSMNLGISSQNAMREFSQVQTNTFFSVFRDKMKKEKAGTISTSTGNEVNTLRGNGGATSVTCPPNTNPNNCKGVDPRTVGNGKKKGLSNHFPF